MESNESKHDGELVAELETIADILDAQSDFQLAHSVGVARWLSSKTRYVGITFGIISLGLIMGFIAIAGEPSANSETGRVVLSLFAIGIAVSALTWFSFVTIVRDIWVSRRSYVKKAQDRLKDLPQ